MRIVHMLVGRMHRLLLGITRLRVVVVDDEDVFIVKQRITVKNISAILSPELVDDDI